MEVFLTTKNESKQHFTALELFASQFLRKAEVIRKTQIQ